MTADLAADDRPARGIAGWAALIFWMLFAMLLVAGIVHITTVFLVPRYAPHDGWSRLSPILSERGWTVLKPDASGLDPVPGLDPLFLHAACRLDLASAPASLVLEAPERFWSAALYDRRGQVVFSLNDRTAAARALDMLVVTPGQNARLREGPREDVAETIIVESPASQLLALVRLYAPTPAARQQAEAALTRSVCAPAPFQDPI
jgi:uncharacterized membrane protein